VPDSNGWLRLSRPTCNVSAIVSCHVYLGYVRQLGFCHGDSTTVTSTSSLVTSVVSRYRARYDSEPLPRIITAAQRQPVLCSPAGRGRFLLQRGAHAGQGFMYVWTNVSDGNASEAVFSFSPRFAYRTGAWSFEMLRF
jgi:hypothetical protein